jgi:hypothetical protein
MALPGPNEMIAAGFEQLVEPFAATDFRAMEHGVAAGIVAKGPWG